jgi:hypothetical protein
LTVRVDCRIPLRPASASSYSGLDDAHQSGVPTNKLLVHGVRGEQQKSVDEILIKQLRIKR